MYHGEGGHGHGVGTRLSPWQNGDMAVYHRDTAGDTVVWGGVCAPLCPQCHPGRQRPHRAPLSWCPLSWSVPTAQPPTAATAARTAASSPGTTGTTAVPLSPRLSPHQHGCPLVTTAVTTMAVPLSPQAANKAPRSAAWVSPTSVLGDDDMEPSLLPGLGTPYGAHTPRTGLVRSCGPV